MMNIVGHTKVIYIRVEAEESWGPIHPLVEPCFGLVKIGHKLNNWFLKLGIFCHVKTSEIRHLTQCHISDIFFCYHTLDLGPSVNSLGSKFYSRPIRLLVFVVSLVLDHGVNPS